MGYIITSTLLLVGARLLSTIFWLCATPQVGRPPRSLRFAIFFAVVLGAAEFAPTALYALAPTVLALLYFAALVPAVHALASMWSPATLVGFVLNLVGWLLVSIVVPMHLVSGDARLAFVVRGFEFALASFSYIADAKRFQSADIRQCYFFLLVNPVLVFHQFGKRTGPPTLRARHLARCSLGACTLAGYFCLDLVVDKLPFSAETMELARVRSLTDYGRFLAATGVVAASTYLAHSGTASVQIGAMRLAGYVVPERYNCAFLAVSPADWWRRWNTYVSTWFASYCLMPSIIYLRRNLRISATVASAASVVACFSISGLIHATGATTALQARAVVLAFVAEALFVLVWLGAASWALVLARNLPAYAQRTLARVSPVGAWALRIQVNLAILSFLFPALTGGPPAP